MFKLIQCESQMRPVRRYERGGTYRMINVRTYEPGPDARAFDAAMYKRWVDSEGVLGTSAVAEAMGLTAEELMDLVKGIYTIENWPEAHQLLREMPVPKRGPEFSKERVETLDPPADDE